MKRHLELAVAPLLLALGCVGSESPPGGDAGGPTGDAGATPALVTCESVSGSRLSQIYYQPNAEHRHMLGIHDDELDTRCEPVTHADGVTRCYPAGTGGQLFFLDEACGQAVVGFSGEPAAFHQRTIAGECAAEVELREIGAPVVIEVDSMVYRLGAGGCEATTAPDLTYHQAGAVLAPGAFATLTAGEEPAGTRLAARTYRGADGSVFCRPQSVLLDRELEVTCEIGRGADGETRCLPSGAAPISFFTDPECTAEAQAAVHAATCGEPPPRYVRESAGEGCGSGLALTEVGEPLEVTRYADSGGTCTAIDDTAVDVYELGEPVAATELARLTLQPEGGDARLQRQLYVADDGFGAHSGGWYDSRLEVSCGFARAADGRIRCLPPGLPPTTLFLDNDCQTSIEVILVSSCGGAEHAREILSEGRSRIVATEPAPATLYQQAGDVCEVADPGDFDVRALTFELSPTSFVEVEELTD